MAPKSASQRGESTASSSKKHPRSNYDHDKFRNDKCFSTYEEFYKEQEVDLRKTRLETSLNSAQKCV